MGKMLSEQLRKVEQSNRLVTAELQRNKKCHILTIFPVLGKLTHLSNDSWMEDKCRICLVCSVVTWDREGKELDTNCEMN